MTIIKGLLARTTDAARRKAQADMLAAIEDQAMFALLLDHQPLPIWSDEYAYLYGLFYTEAEMICDCILRK